VDGLDRALDAGNDELQRRVHHRAGHPRRLQLRWLGGCRRLRRLAKDRGLCGGLQLVAQPLRPNGRQRRGATLTSAAGRAGAGMPGAGRGRAAPAAAAKVVA
jgi:hypothetical protein